MRVRETQYVMNRSYDHYGVSSEIGVHSAMPTSAPTYINPFFPYTAYGNWSRITDQIANGGQVYWKNVAHKASRPAYCSGVKTFGFPSSGEALAYGAYYEIRHDSFDEPYPAFNYASLCDQLANDCEESVGDQSMLFVTLYELGQTIRMVRNPFGLLKGGALAAKHSTSSLQTILKSGSNIWLEYLYGWKSAYRDINDLAKAAGSTMVDLIYKYQGNSRAFERLSRTQTLTSTLPDLFVGSVPNESAWNAAANDPLNYIRREALRIYFRRVTSTCRVAIQKLLIHQERLATTKRILSALKLRTWRDVRDTLWEIVPFSFVLDWFVDTRGIWAPINRQALSAMPHRAIGYSVKSLYTFSADVLPCRPMFTFYNAPVGAYTPHSWVSGDVVFGNTAPGSSYRYDRVYGLPPSNDWSTLLTNRGLSTTQLASGLSLIAQRIL